jgi:gliding motility-associated-like protein
VLSIDGSQGADPTAYTFEWSNGANGASVSDLLGDQSYTVTATDSEGCTQTASLELENPVAVSFSLQATPPSCAGLMDGSIAILNLAGPHGNDFDIAWDAATGNQTSATATNLSAGTYAVTITDNLGCQAEDQLTLNEPSAIELSYVVTDNPCFADALGTITVTASGGSPDYTYNWATGEQSAQLTQLPAGDYALTVTDREGCEALLDVRVTEPQELSAKAIATDISCFGERNGMIDIAPEGGTPPFRYRIDNDNLITNTRVIGLFAGEYQVEVVDANGCTFRTEATINEPPEFSVDAGPDLTITFGDSISLAATTENAQGSVEFVWLEPYFGTLSCTECPNPVASPEATLDYEIYVVDEQGCEASDFLRLFVEKPQLATVPTGFTPNGDTTNDLLLVHGRPGTQVVRFQVFDRWGELLYEAGDFPVNDAGVGWDGNYRGEPMGSGVYLWLIEVIHQDGSNEVLRGQTTLIR